MHTYLFYTHNVLNEDIIVTIGAESIDAAWTKFRSLYGPRFVDLVRELLTWSTSSLTD